MHAGDAGRAAPRRSCAATSCAPRALQKLIERRLRQERAPRRAARAEASDDDRAVRMRWDRLTAPGQPTARELVANTNMRGNALATMPACRPSSPVATAARAGAVRPSAIRRRRSASPSCCASAAPTPRLVPRRRRTAAPLAAPPHGDEADAQESSARGARRERRRSGRATRRPGTTPNAKARPARPSVDEHAAAPPTADARQRRPQRIDRRADRSPHTGRERRRRALASPTAPPRCRRQRMRDRRRRVARAIAIDGRRRDARLDRRRPRADATRGALEPSAPGHARGQAAVDAARAPEPLAAAACSATAAAADPHVPQCARRRRACRRHRRARSSDRDGTFDALAAAGALPQRLRAAADAAGARTAMPTVPTLPTPSSTRLRRRARRAGQRAGARRRAARRAPSQPGRDRAGVGADRASTAAQRAVDFGADLAATRQAIEAACPSWRARCATPG